MKLLTILLALMFVAQVSAVGVGDDAPDFTLSNVDGGSFTLSEQLGKVIMIFTFGNTCPHCIANGPNTESGIYQTLKNNSDFVAVGVDTWDGSSGQVQSFRASTGITYPLLLNGSSVQQDYTTTYDRVIVVDKDGVIQYKSSNNATTAVVAEAKAVIDQLLLAASLEADGDLNKGLTTVYIEEGGTLRFNNPYNIEGLATYSVMDMSGQILQSGPVSLSETNSVLLSDVTPGMCFLVINNGQKVYVRRFLR
jgi:peroxiredoxin